MAAADGEAAHTLETQLRERPAEFDFFQAVRRLECACAGRSVIGISDHPREDPVRFCQATTLAFPPSSLAAFVPAGEDRPARLFVCFMGLLGPNGPMPLALTEYVYDRVHNADDLTFARFLDLFNHRMVSLLYRAWAESQQSVSRDCPDTWTFDRYVGSLAGIGLESFRHGDAVPDDAKLHHVGPLSCQAKHVEGLESFVSEFLGVPAKVVEFIGRWMEIPAHCRCRLGAHPDTGTLGRSLFVGERMRECQHKFRIRLGPMGLGDYERLLPHTPNFRRLVDVVRNYIGDELLWDAQLVLVAAEVPRVRLGGYGRLGWTTWLSTRRFERDTSDLVVHESRIETLKTEERREAADG